jgi:hypothetical protein
MSNETQLYLPINSCYLVHHFLNEYANFKALYHPSCISNGRLLAVH